jgi:hypothetical protein
MATTAATAATSGEVLFFIPDIGGFTKFVTETEIAHSQHIISELLELIVDANTLGLEVGEFEGDAVLFFRHGAPPSLDALVEQARHMFVAFHTHLQRIEYYRVCQCGACSSTSKIKLKMVAHAGQAGLMKVKDQRKFIGKDIIVAHRLLKNSVAEPEYLLFTQSTLARARAADAELAGFEAGANAYDELGSIDYRYKSLACYLPEVRVDPPSPFALESPVQVLRLEQRVAAPAERVFQTLIDLPARMKWIEGIKSVEFRDEQPNHVGKVHRCVREGGGKDPELITSSARSDAQKMELWETDTKKTAACRYLLTKADGGGDTTDLALEFYVRDNLLMRLMFRLLMRRKLKPAFEKSLRNLAALCEGATAGSSANGSGALQAATAR